MIYFRPVTEEDRARLEEWIAADPWRTAEGPERKDPAFWITGNPYPCICTFRADDSEGNPLLYFRLDRATGNIGARFHTQFAPETVVSKRKLVGALLEGFPAIIKAAQSMKLQFLVFETKSDLLAKFMAKSFQFEKESTTPDDYILLFGAEEEKCQKKQ